MTVRQVGLFPALLAMMALTGCASGRFAADDLPTQEWSGHFVSGPGESWFSPCPASVAHGVTADAAPWWVTVTGMAVGQVEQARRAGAFLPGERYFVRWRAAMTRNGEVGPRGPGVPALLVRELVTWQPASSQDCLLP